MTSVIRIGRYLPEVLTWIRALLKAQASAYVVNWQPVANAPFDRDLELAVIDYDGTHALVFPCRRILTGWMKSGTQQLITVRPTHWREWGVASPLSPISKI
jgi:hypothetical protein